METQHRDEQLAVVRTVLQNKCPTCWNFSSVVNTCVYENSFQTINVQMRTFVGSNVGLFSDRPVVSVPGTPANEIWIRLVLEAECFALSKIFANPITVLRFPAGRLSRT